MEILFLGTGTSHGVPSIDCIITEYKHCPKAVCRDSLFDKKHRRTRSSVLIRYNNNALLIDVSSDFRYQILRENITKIDAVLLTHPHADHIMGIPDIRSFCATVKNKMPLYGSLESLQELKATFSYIFNPHTTIGGGIPNLSLYPVTKEFELFGEKIVPITVEHANIKGCYGYRIGNVAYISDVKHIHPDEFVKLKGLNLLIIDCLRDKEPHPTHIIMEESIKISRTLCPKRTLFTHMSHSINYLTDTSKLDASMDFSFDGMHIHIEDE